MMSFARVSAGVACSCLVALHADDFTSAAGIQVVGLQLSRGDNKLFSWTAEQKYWQDVRDNGYLKSCREYLMGTPEQLLNGTRNLVNGVSAASGKAKGAVKQWNKSRAKKAASNAVKKAQKKDAKEQRKQQREEQRELAKAEKEMQKRLKDQGLLFPTQEFLTARDC